MKCTTEAVSFINSDVYLAKNIPTTLGLQYISQYNVKNFVLLWKS